MQCKVDLARMITLVGDTGRAPCDLVANLICEDGWELEFCFRYSQDIWLL